MKRFRSSNKWATAMIVITGALLASACSVIAETPNVGSKAPDFTLSTPEGQMVRLSDQLSKGKVVLVVLRGYPGYQCPYCQRQAHDFQLNAVRFAESGV